MSTHLVFRENWLTRKFDSRSAAIATLSVLALLFGSLIYWGSEWSEWIPASHTQVYGQHQWWRAWTTLLAHADIRHLLSNCLLFFILGIFLHGYFGAWVFPTLAFALGGVINLIVLLRMKGEIHLVGVSGVVFWMGGFWLVLYFFLDRRRSVIQRALRSLGVGLALFMPTEAFDPTISYKAHLVGFLLGAVSGFPYFFWRRKEFRAAEVVEVVVDEGEFD